MTNLVVVPFLDRRRAAVCVTSCFRPNTALGPADVMLVDNRRTSPSMSSFGASVEYVRDPDGHNLGPARSWNIAARRVLADGYDYLTLCSSSVEFGSHGPGGPTWHAHLAAADQAAVVATEVHFWHLISISREALAAVGLFDENFYPGYEEDVDYGRRLALAGATRDTYRIVAVNAISHGFGISRHAVSVNRRALTDYYRRKWGGPKGAETFVTPFGDPRLGLDAWQAESIPSLADRYGLEDWW